MLRVFLGLGRCVVVLGGVFIGLPLWGKAGPWGVWGHGCPWRGVGQRPTKLKGGSRALPPSTEYER